MTSTSPYTIKPYQDNDEVHIIPLFEKVFRRAMGKTESAEHWRWEFLENPVKPMTTMLAWDGERLVSQEAANLLRFVVDGRDYLGALIFDSMTDPEYAGRGIFTETAKALYKYQKKKSCEFVYGFPNANVIQARIKKLGWNIISKMPIYVRPIDVGTLVRKKTGSALLEIIASKISSSFSTFMHNRTSILNHKIEIRKDGHFDKWADDLWSRCFKQHKLWVVRDYKYLSWRYDMRPESQYNLFTAWLNNDIVGYIITTSQIRNEGKICFILDVMVDANVAGAAEVLLKSVVDFSMHDNDAMISALLMPASIYRSAFKKFFFVPLPQKLFPQEIYFGGCQLNHGIGPEIFKNPTSWHISWGDTDLL